MVWDVAKSLDKLLAQINALAPGRSKKSDGSIGDTAHKAGKSEHNPEDKPGSEPDEVDARDFTHDPAKGADMDKIAESLRLSRDHRILYVIWRQRMFSSYPMGGYPAWAWRPYRGHYHSHLHVSVNDVDDDNTAPWQITLPGTATAPPQAQPVVDNEPEEDDDMKPIVYAKKETNGTVTEWAVAGISGGVRYFHRTKVQDTANAWAKVYGVGQGSEKVPVAEFERLAAEFGQPAAVKTG